MRPAVVRRGEVHLGVEREFAPERKARPAFLARLVAAGVATTAKRPLDGFERCHIAGPSGNRIALMQIGQS